MVRTRIRRISVDGEKRLFRRSPVRNLTFYYRALSILGLADRLTGKKPLS